MSGTNQHRLIQALHDPALYRHPVSNVTLKETHANWILLAGDYAYKIKKPVNFGFLDFTTLEKRRFYCEEEIRLNRRLAPEIYLRVLPITGSFDHPRMDGEGEPIEHAVLMKRFDSERGLDRLIESREPAPEIWDAFAEDLARFHRNAPAAAPDSGFGTPELIWRNASDNFSQVGAMIDDADRSQLETIHSWARQRFDSLLSQFEARQRDGRIRECHGDLHCANLVLHEERIIAFDCLEFNESLRWIDTANEIAFLLMDLRDRRQPQLSARWRSHYLEWLGDYEAVPLLSFYESYRAMVRCKVALLAAEQAGDELEHAESERAKARHYLETASNLTRPGQPWIIITHGLAGSGKSTVALGLVEVFPALRLRSDIERKRLFGLDPLAGSGSGLDTGIYEPEATKQTYRHLADLAGMLIDAGETVVVDATFLDQRMRTLMRDTARQRQAPFAIVHATAPFNELENRVLRRRRGGDDPSEADTEVLERQIETADALTLEERRCTVDVDTAQTVDFGQLADRIRALLP